jgi:rare lipoprotein A
MLERSILRLGIIALLALAPLIAIAKPAPGDTLVGIASYYHDKFHGRKTANGERFNQAAYTAAHKKLPFGTKVRVIDRKTGKSVVVTINDRGPFIKGRVIDLSRRAARDLGILHRGVAKVKVEILSVPTKRKRGI